MNSHKKQLNVGNPYNYSGKNPFQVIGNIWGIALEQAVSGAGNPHDEKHGKGNPHLAEIEHCTQNVPNQNSGASGAQRKLIASEEKTAGRHLVTAGTVSNGHQAEPKTLFFCQAFHFLPQAWQTQ